MEVFALVVFGGLVLVLLALLGLGAWSPRSVNELTGRSDERRLADQAMIEERDIDEMVDAHNVSRRRRGKAELGREEIQRRANEAQQRSIEQAERD